MANAGHSCRIHPDFAHISGMVGTNWGKLRLSGRSSDRIEFKMHWAIWDARVGGRARAKAGDFRAGGHDMYEKAGTYVKFARFSENACY
jgi:hypothetical protein